MDRSAEYVSLGIVRRKHQGLSLKLVALSSLFPLMAAAAARLLWSVPKPALLVVAVVFVICLAGWWLAARRLDWPPRVLVPALVSTWMLSAALFLGSLYQVDRGSWLWYQATGYNTTFSEQIPVGEELTVREFLQRNGAFSLDPSDSTCVVLESGNHSFDRTVIIPPHLDLKIEPGTTLRFKGGRSLISYGRVIARGTDKLPIVFTAQTQLFKWGVLGVVSSEKSVFENVRFMHGRQAQVNGIDFNGCLSLIGGEVDIRHCRFTQLYGKDGVYARDAQVLIQENLFQHTLKDGLDLDGGAGVISHNQFLDCQDEGIDLSDNHGVSVFDNEILDAKGGRIGADHDLEAIRSRNILGFSDLDRHAQANARQGAEQP